MPLPRHHARWRRSWGRTNLWLLRVVCGIECRIPRPGENSARAPLIVASKHQSVWETFALLPLFDDPTFILKRELMWIPLFGWFTWKGRMVPVDRGARLAGAGRHDRARAHRTRRRPPAHHLSRRHAARRPAPSRATSSASRISMPRAACPACRSRSIPDCSGRAARSAAFRARCVVEFLDPIPPGLDKEVFFAAPAARHRDGDRAADRGRPSARSSASGSSMRRSSVRRWRDLVHALQPLRQQMQFGVADSRALRAP